MPRRSRCIVPGLPCHVTQRGVNRCDTFCSDQDRSAYLRFLRENLEDAHARLLGWSRNVLLTGSSLEGGRRTATDDPSRARPAGGLEEGQEETDHPKARKTGTA